MTLLDALNQSYYTGMLTLAIVALAIAIMLYPTIKANIEEEKKRKRKKK